MGFGVWGLGFGIWGLGFIPGARFWLCGWIIAYAGPCEGFSFSVQCSVFKVSVLVLVWGSGCRVWSSEDSGFDQARIQDSIKRGFRI